MTELAQQVDAAAAAVAGVARLYSAGPAVAGVVRAVVGAEEAAASSVREGDPVTVTVSIGVEDSERSGDVAERVAAAVREVAGAGAVVHVRVSRVHA
jgi:hypothetical protein